MVIFDIVEKDKIVKVKLPPRSEMFLAIRLATLSHCLCKTPNQRCAPKAIPLYT